MDDVMKMTGNELMEAYDAELALQIRNSHGGGPGACNWERTDTIRAELLRRLDAPAGQLITELSKALTAMISFGEEVERENLVGHEGCFWPVELARAAKKRADEYFGQPTKENKS